MEGMGIGWGTDLAEGLFGLRPPAEAAPWSRRAAGSVATALQWFWEDQRTSICCNILSVVLATCWHPLLGATVNGCIKSTTHVKLYFLNSHPSAQSALARASTSMPATKSPRGTSSKQMVPVGPGPPATPRFKGPVSRIPTRRPPSAAGIDDIATT